MGVRRTGRIGEACPCQARIDGVPALPEFDGGGKAQHGAPPQGIDKGADEGQVAARRQAEHRTGEQDEFDRGGGEEAEEAWAVGLPRRGGGAQAAAPGAQGGQGEALGGAEGGAQPGLLEEGQAVPPLLIHGKMGAAEAPRRNRRHGGSWVDRREPEPTRPVKA
jgi:hypothetical protein